MFKNYADLQGYRSQLKNVVFVGTVLLASFAHANAQSICIPATAGCSGADRSNSFLSSSDPNTIEYDNIVSTFHSTMARQADGTVLVWGERMHYDGVSHILSPQALNATNYPALTGDVLKFTGGSFDKDNEQFVVLTTTGLFAWGKSVSSSSGTAQNLLHSSLITSAAFQKITVGGKTDGLPAGVSPADVKMLFGSYRTLALVTCDGAAWVLSTAGNKNGDGTVDNFTNNRIWHRVKIDATTNLTGVVALRGGNGALVALKSDGTLWTWGDFTYLGDGTGLLAKTYATQMTLPALAAGEVPKMIGMVSCNNLMFFSPNLSTATYYLLTSAGNVYALGCNNTPSTSWAASQNLLGDFTTVAESLNWVRVKKSAAAGDYLTNVAWISPQEHDGEWGAINVLTQSGITYAWGSNDEAMTGGPAFVADINPTAMPGGLTAADKILAVETGGHTTIVVKNCTSQFGYVGHRINGSMADGTTADVDEYSYNFTATAVLDLCGASPQSRLFVNAGDTTVCIGSSLTLHTNFVPLPGDIAVLSGNATLAGTTLTLTGAGDVVLTYTASGMSCPVADTLTLYQRDFGNLDTAVWPVAHATVPAGNQVFLGADNAESDCGTDVSDDAEGFAISGSTGSGTAASPWILTGSGSTYSGTLTLNTNSTTPVNISWAAWYDADGSGAFNDAIDLFYSGTRTGVSGLVTVPVSVTVPYGSGQTEGAFRIVATAGTTTFTKAMNGTVGVINGEVEDYYVAYSTALPVELLSFGATIKNDKAWLTWATATEINNKGFEVLKSTDGRNWLSIGFVASLAQGGHSSSRLEYSFPDNTPAPGLNHYRIRQTGFDGTYAYSPVRTLRFNAPDQVTLYPNPVLNELKLQGLTGKSTVSISSITGQVLIQVAAADTTIHTIDMSSLTRGIYFVTIRSEAGAITVHKVSKQ